jgi:hypothetical protein
MNMYKIYVSEVRTIYNWTSMQIKTVFWMLNTSEFEEHISVDSGPVKVSGI